MVYKPPVYRSQLQPTFGVGYRQQIQADPEAFGAGLGNAIAQAGAGVGNAIRRFQHDTGEADEALAQKAINQVLNYERELLNNNENGLVAQRGEAALAASNAFKGYLDSTARQAFSTLKNQRQRQIFEDFWQRERRSFYDKVDSHAGRQAKEFFESEHEALLSNLTEKALADAADSNYSGANDSIRLIADAVEQNGIRNGLGEQARMANRRKAVTTAHVKVLATMLEIGRAEEAHEYLATVKSLKDEIDTNVLKSSKIEAVVQEARYAHVGRTLAERALQGDPEKGLAPATVEVVRPWDKTLSPVKRIDEGAAQARIAEIEANKSLPASVRQAARESIEDAMKTSRATWKSMLDDTYERAITKLQNNGWRMAALAEEKAFLNDPDVNGGEVWRKIEDTHRARLNQDAGRAATPQQREAMVRFLLTLNTRHSEYINPENVKAFMAEWGPQLSPSDYEKAAGYVAREGLAANRPDENLPLSVVQRIKSDLASYGVWENGRKEPKSAVDQRIFLDVYYDLLATQADMRRQGKLLTDDMVKQKIQYHATKGRVKGANWLGLDKTGVPRVKAQVQFPGHEFVAEIPEADRQRVLKAFSERGMPVPSNEMVLQVLRAERAEEEARQRVLRQFEKRGLPAPSEEVLRQILLEAERAEQ